MDDRFEFGRTIGAYRIVRPLGSGGMGAVYEVEHLQLRTHRALKVFAVEGENVELHRKRFLSEGKMLAALDHPRVVHVHEFDVDAESGRPYFVMDLVLSPDGTPRTLADAAGSEVADEKRAAALFRDVCEGLDYVHSLGIVHRDIKLENILIGPDGRAVLSDFGISRIFDDELRQKLDITLTMPQDESVIRRLGSAFYLAPEQQGATPDKATPASDAWALGVMIFRFLTGFWFERENREKCLALLDDCELPWRPLIARLCAETPEERLAEGGFGSLADTLKQRSSMPAGPRRRRVLVWAAALAVVAAGVAFALLRPGKGKPTSMHKVDQPVLRISANFDDLKLLNGGNDVAIPGVPANVRFLSLSWTEATIAKVLAVGGRGPDAIARLVVNGERWQNQVSPGLTIDLPQGVDKVRLYGHDVGDSFMRVLDVENLSRLVLRARPDDGFVSNSTCFVEARLYYKNAAQADEAGKRLEKLFKEIKQLRHMSTATTSGDGRLMVTTSFGIDDASEVIGGFFGGLLSQRGELLEGSRCEEEKYIKPIEDVLNRHDDEMKKEMEAIRDKVEEACPEVSTNQPLVRVRREQKRRERKMAEMAKRLMFEEVMAKYIPLYDKAFAEAKEMKVPAHLEARKRELINDQEWDYQEMKSAKEQYDLEAAKRKATGATDEDDEKPPTDGKWHGLEWADVWAESVRTNAALPTAWKYFTEQFRPYVRRNLMVPEEGPFAKDVSELVDGLARTLWTPWTPLDEEFAGWGIIGDFNRAMELRGKGCSNLVVRVLATIGDYRQHMKKRGSIDPKGKESEPYRLMKAELAAHGGVPLLRYIYGRQISWWSDSDAMKDILDGLKARPQDRRVVYNIIGTPEEACAADPWFELMAVAADERYAARKVRNYEERCQHRGKAREALEKAYAQHPEVVETAVALLKDAVDSGNEEAKELWFGRILELEVDNRDSWYLYAACWASVERLRMFFEVLWMIDRKDMFFRYQAAEFLVYMDQQAGGKGKFFLDPGQKELYLKGCYGVIDGAMVDDETVIRAREGIVRRYWEVGDMEGAGKAYQELIARAPYRFQRHGSWFEDMDLVIPALGGAHAKELIEMERFYQKNFAKVRRPTKAAVEEMRTLLKPLKEKSSELSHAERMLFNTRNGAMSISLE